MTVQQDASRLDSSVEGRGAGVLLVGNFLSRQPGVRSVGEELALRLATTGRHVVTTSDQINRGLRLLDMIATAWRARDQYAVAQVDVFSGAAFLWAEAVCWTLRRAGKPYILTLHGGNLPAFSLHWPGRVRRLLGSASAVTTPSRYLFEQMIPYREDLQLLPNPLHVPKYTFRLREQAEPRLIWLRAFHAVYNPTLAPAVVAWLKPQFPSIHLSMVGPDKGDGSLQRTQEAARQHDVTAHIAFPGGVPNRDVPRWLQKGDIFLNTTNVDNAPVSVLEAMACGLCVVSTNVGGIPYLLEHEQNALLVPPDDAEAMAKAVQRLLTQPALARHLSHHAHLKAEQFDGPAIIAQWECLLEKVGHHA